MKVVKVSRGPEGLNCRFYCPGCKSWHVIPSRSDGGQPSWDFNGDEDRPTFSPSIMVRGVREITDAERDRIMNGEHIEPEPRLCHSFVRGGRIEFLSDCTHELAGQTVDLPPIPEGKS